MSRLELLPPPRGHSLWSRPPQPLQAPVPASQLREPLCSAPSPDGASRHQAGPPRGSPPRSPVQTQLLPASLFPTCLRQECEPRTVTPRWPEAEAPLCFAA